MKSPFDCRRSFNHEWHDVPKVKCPECGRFASRVPLGYLAPARRKEKE